MNSRFFELSHDLLYVTTLDGSERHFNEAWEAVLGWRLGESDSDSMLDVIHPEDLASHRVPIDRLLRGEVINFEGRMRVLTADGGSRTVNWHGLHDLDTATIFFAGRDVTDEANLAAQLAEREAALSNLVAELVHVREAERARIAGELHDGALQSVIAASMFLGVAGENAAASAQAAEQVDACIAALRSVMAGLATDRTVHGGLEHALRAIVAETSSQFQLDVDGRYDIGDEPSQEVAATVCRVVREGLVNVGKHAGSARATVEIETNGRSMTVSVRDEGSTATRPEADAVSAPRGSGYGLAALSELVRVQDGTMTIDITPDGAQLFASLPAGWTGSDLRSAAREDVTRLADASPG